MGTTKEYRTSLATQLLRRVPAGTVVRDLRSGISGFRMQGPIPPTSGVMEPAVCFIFQGTKRAHFDGRPHTYEQGSFLLSSVAVPLQGEVVVASEDCPLVGLSYTLNLRTVAKLIAEIGVARFEDPGTDPSAISVHPMDEAMLQTLTRLCAATEDDLTWKILGEGLERELMFRVLQHPGAGWQLRQRLRHEASLDQVARAVAFIEAHLTESLDVDRISREAGLSPSRLHAKFRAVTSRSPMQYVKYLRLHRARGLLLTGEPVTDVAFSVGYGSSSQFSREFRRQYGHPPSEVGRQVAWARQPELV